jgi:hypothetical protein
VTFARVLMRVEMRAFAALLACAVTVALVFGVVSFLTSSNYADPWTLALPAFQVTFLSGLLPVLLYGAPAYALLKRADRMNWAYAVLLGVVPGLCVLPYGLSAGATTMACGVAVACFTHYLAKDDETTAGSNNRLQRTGEG